MDIISILLDSKDPTNTTLTMSVSKLKTFESCAAKFKFCYIDKLPKIDRDFHIFGKFIHFILEQFHKHMISHPQDDWEEILKICWAKGLGGMKNFSSEFSEEQYKEFSEEEINGYRSILTKDQIPEAKEILYEYKEILKEEGIPNIINVEKPFYINVNNQILLNGFIDRIQIDKDKMIHVADYKTTKDKKYLDDFFQVKTYCFALMLADESIKKIRASFILLRHHFDYMTEEYTREEILSEVPKKFVEGANKILEERLFRPSPQFLCKYCDYLTSCKAGEDFLQRRGIYKAKIEKPLMVGIQKHW